MNRGSMTFAGFFAAAAKIARAGRSGFTLL
jgi:hypothetical protein